MVGMCGLQTSHRYGNANMLASDFVFGIGNRWANRHTGSVEVYTKGRKFIHVDIEPTQIGRVFAPDYGIVSDAKAALEQFVAVAKEWKAAGKLKCRKAWVAECQGRKNSVEYLRKTNFDNVPMKPQRVYQCMNRTLDRDTTYVSTIGLSQIAGAQFLHVYKPRNWINCGQAGPLGWTTPPPWACAWPTPAQDRGAVRRLRLPVHDRRAGRGRAVQAALCSRAGEQQLPGSDPSGTARFLDRLLRAIGVRQYQHG
jgi:tartronate-semialdehyde synthase